MPSPREMAHALRAFATDPVTVARALPAEWQQHRGLGRLAESDFDDDWYEHLHGLLGVPWPCQETQYVRELLGDINALLEAEGVGTGRHTYGWYSDAEFELVSALWCTVRHTKPDVVVETGVAHGVSSRIVLEALSRNDRGHLWSIDLPHPLEPGLRAQTGIAVTDELRPRWTYLEGESRRRLPPLLAEVGEVQIFVHDSLHTAKNTLFEMESAASAMTGGGIMLVDDIRGHDGFPAFTRAHPDYQTLLCSTQDRQAGFGIAAHPDAVKR